MISVCLASHNGADYIQQQIDTILHQLQLQDELVVVDDCSQDDTVNIIRSFADDRIRLFHNDRQLGHVKTFAKAITEARGKYIFLADQDDIWPPGRVNLMRSALDKDDCQVVAGNFKILPTKDTAPQRQQKILLAAQSNHTLSNLLGILLGRRPYYGCAMAFDRSLKKMVLPIPEYVESHDLWIAMIGNTVKKMSHLEEEVLIKREHGKNLSAPARRPWPTIVQSRIKMVLAEMIILNRARRLKANSGK
ncbi:glycosyltransferase [Gilvimarinus chinensis]|uniref:glycosyltransferase n=1 Tax=Gilvimarinus chinensis TaxID=396005 RepID=UPI00037336CF|nr:glycosyltransferase [Gilvimarinus chinensis]